MRVLRDKGPLWVGFAFECYDCRAIIQLERGDDVAVCPDLDIGNAGKVIMGKWIEFKCPCGSRITVTVDDVRRSIEGNIAALPPLPQPVSVEHKFKNNIASFGGFPPPKPSSNTTAEGAD